MGGRIYYVEYWVDGRKVTDVPRGAHLIYKVVFGVDEEGTYRVCIQRQPGGQRVCDPWWDLKPLTPPQAYVAEFEEPKVTEPPGGYKLYVWLEQKGVGVVDERWFPLHIVEAGATQPVEKEVGGAPSAATPVPHIPIPVVIGGVAAVGAVAALLLARRGGR